MTKDDEARVLAMLDAFENGKRVADLDEVEPEKSVDAMIEVTDSDGESRRASLGTLLQATDAKERLDKTDESINTLTEKVDALVDSTTVRRWTSQKISNVTLSVLNEDGGYCKIIPIAPMTSEDESRFNETATLTADGQISRLLWDGDMYIPGSDEIRKGDVINGVYIATANAQTLQWGDRRYRIIEMADSNNNRYVLTSAPCSSLDHFVQISYQDYIESGLGKVGLVVRIPGLFCTDEAQYIKDAGLMEVDYGNGCFVLVNYSGGRFNRWPNPIHFEEYNPIYRTRKEGLEYKRCKGWTIARDTQNQMVKIDIEVSCGDTIGYRVGDNQCYTLFPFIGEDPESKLCRAGIRYVELPFAYAPSQVGEVAECTLSLEDDPLYGKYDERNIQLAIYNYLSGVKVPDCAFFPGSELKIRSENWNHPYSVNLKVIDRDADFMERLCPTRQYDGMKPQSATFRAEVTFNDGTEKLEGTAEFLIRPVPANSRMVNRAYSTASRPSTTLDVDTDAIEAGQFYLSSDLIGLKKVLRLWCKDGNTAEVTNDRLMTARWSDGGEPVEVDGHEVYRVAYHPDWFVLPDVGIDGTVPRDDREEDDSGCVTQRLLELYQYSAGDYVEFVYPDGSVTRRMMTKVDYESQMIITNDGDALLADFSNPVAGFYNISCLGTATIEQLTGKCVAVGYDFLPWSDASRDDGGQLKHVAEISGFRGRVQNLFLISGDGTTAKWQLDMMPDNDDANVMYVAWPGDSVILSGAPGIEPVTVGVESVCDGQTFYLAAPSGIQLDILNEAGGLVYSHFNISRPVTYGNPQRYVTPHGIEGVDWIIIRHHTGEFTAVRRWEQPGTSNIFGWQPGSAVVGEWHTGSSVECHCNYGQRLGASEAWAGVIVDGCHVGFTGYFYLLREMANPRTDDQPRYFDFSAWVVDSNVIAAVRVGDTIQFADDQYEVTCIATDAAWQQLRAYVITADSYNYGTQHRFTAYPDPTVYSLSFGGISFPTPYNITQDW